MKKKEQFCRLRSFMMPLLAGVAFSALSSSVVYADEVEEPVDPAYKISSQIVTGAKKYFDDSPYAARNRTLETQPRPPVKRRPLSFVNEGALPPVPAVEAQAQDDSTITVGTAIPAAPEVDDTLIAPAVLPNQIDDLDMVDLLVEEPITPDALQEAEAVAVHTQPENEPRSLMDTVLSVFESEEEPVIAPVVSPVAGALKVKPINAGISVPMEVRPRTNLGAPIKTIIIEKIPAGQHSSLEKTRQIIMPPEIKKMAEKKLNKKAEIPPLVLMRERFKEDLIAEPPLSALGKISQEIEATEPVIQETALPSMEVLKEERIVEPQMVALPKNLPEAKTHTISSFDKPVVVYPERIQEVAVSDTPLPAEPIELILPKSEVIVPEEVQEVAVMDAPAPVELILPESKPVEIAAPSKVGEVLQEALDFVDEKLASPKQEEIAAHLPESLPEKTNMPDVTVPSLTALLDSIDEVAEPLVAEKVAVVAPKVVAMPKAVITPKVAIEAPAKPEAKPVKMAMAAPVQNVVVMQKLPSAKPVDKLRDASVVIEEAQQVEISKDSKMMLKNFPAGLNAPEVKMQAEKVEISRATVPDLEVSKPKIKKHEALGISIEVQKPSLNVNDYLVMAYEAMQEGQFSLASGYYQAILDTDDNHEDAILGLATVSHRLGDNDNARALYRKLLMKSPRDTAVLNNFLVLVSEEAPEKALRELLDLEAKNPHYDVLPAQLATIYANQGQMENAIAKIIRAIELNPNHLLYRYNLAVMLDHAGQAKQAIRAYSAVKKAIEKGDKIPTDISYIQERLTFLLSNQSS